MSSNHHNHHYPRHDQHVEIDDAVDSTKSSFAPDPAVEPTVAVEDQASVAGMDDQLDQLQAEINNLTEQALRARADAENARRRADEEIAKTRKFALEGFAESLLAVVDSLEAALNIENASAEQLREGTEATHRQLMSVLERNHVREVNPAPGDKFNPNQEQAISTVPSTHPAGSVATVLQKGYLIADRVLRPALVMVAADQ